VPRGCSEAHPVGPLIRYERNSMKTFNFNPCISHTYDDRDRNPCISNTYEKHGGLYFSAAGLQRGAPRRPARPIRAEMPQNSAMGSAVSGRIRSCCSAGHRAGLVEFVIRQHGGWRYRRRAVGVSVAIGALYAAFVLAGTNYRVYP
jgi:hypothetical protein